MIEDWVCPRCGKDVVSQHHVLNDVEIETPGSFCVVHREEETLVYLHEC